LLLKKVDIAKINTLEILIQFDGLSSEQQNITHVTAFGTKTAFYLRILQETVC
jgi:hypothetical protein